MPVRDGRLLALRFAQPTPSNPNPPSPNLAQGTIADLLLELSSSAPAAHTLCPPPFAERLDPFDALPHHAVNDMFTAQATMLRSVLASNTKLREEWLRSKEKLMLSPGTGEENAITLGEAHVLVELQVANQVSGSWWASPPSSFLTNARADT